MARKPGQRSVRRAIKLHGGMVADIARHFDVTRQTIYNWLDFYQMRPQLAAARQDMRAVALDVVYQRLMSDDEPIAYDASKFVLLHLQSDGEPIAISPETQRLLTAMGLTVAGFMADFERVVQEQAVMMLPETIEE